MTIRQKQLLAVSAALFLVMDLFPPWNYEYPNASAHLPAGYQFRFSPPPLKSQEEMRKMFHATHYPPGKEIFFGVRIDYLRLDAQRLVALPWVIGLLILLKKSLSLIVRIVGWMFLGLGLIGFVFFIDMFVAEFGAFEAFARFCDWLSGRH